MASVQDSLEQSVNDSHRTLGVKAMTERNHPRAILRMANATCLCLAMLLASAVRAEELADHSGRWYKGNTHAHTLWSDGDALPGMVTDWYRSHGYDFLAISDHDCLMEGEKWVPVDQGNRPISSAAVKKCQERFGPDWLEFRDRDGHREVKLKTYDEVCAKLAEPGKFLLIPSEEITAKVGDHNVHVNAINLAEPIAPKTGQNVADTLSRNLTAVQEQAERLGRPILAHVNHPNWVEYDVAPEDLAAASAAKFFEVRNGFGGGHHLGDATHPSIERLWDIANTMRLAQMKEPPLYGIASDDTHHYHQVSSERANPGRAWIMVRAKDLSADALLDAMKRGDFYASTGVTLRNLVYDPEQQTVTVDVRAEPGVHYTIEFIGTLKGVDPTGEPVESAESDPRRPGHTYSPEVGKVLAAVQGDSATYRLTGDELYVRPVVRSDRPIPNAPANEPRMQEAWCQPIGWEPQ